MIEFRDYMKLQEGKKNKTYQTHDPKKSDVEELKSGISIKYNPVKERKPTGRRKTTFDNKKGRKTRGDLNRRSIKDY
jgi:hypothetical protein